MIETEQTTSPEISAILQAQHELTVQHGLQEIQRVRLDSLRSKSRQATIRIFERWNAVACQIQRERPLTQSELFQLVRLNKYLTTLAVSLRFAKLAAKQFAEIESSEGFYVN